MDRRTVSYKGPLGGSRKQRRMQKKVGNKKVQLFGRSRARFLAIKKNMRKARGGRGKGKGKRFGKYGKKGAGIGKRGKLSGGIGKRKRYGKGSYGYGASAKRYGYTYVGRSRGGSFRRRRRIPIRRQAYPRQTFDLSLPLSFGREIALISYPSGFVDGQGFILSNLNASLIDATFLSEATERGCHLCLCRMGKSDLPVDSLDDKRIIRKIIIRKDPQGTGLQSINDEGFVKEGVHIIHPFSIRLKNARTRLSVFLLPMYTSSGFRIRTPLTVNPSLLRRKAVPPVPPLVTPPSSLGSEPFDFSSPSREGLVFDDDLFRVQGERGAGTSSDVVLQGTITYSSSVVHYAYNRQGASSVAPLSVSQI